MTAVLKEIERKPNPDVIAGLERALESAGAGNTFGILLIEKTPVAATWTCAGIPDRFEITGYLFHLMYKMQTDDPKPSRSET